MIYRILIAVLIIGLSILSISPGAIFPGAIATAAPQINVVLPVETVAPLTTTPQTLVADAMSPANLSSSPAVSLDHGERIFEANCAGCHANGGNIIRRGKNLYMRALRRNRMDNVEAIAHIVTYGKRPMSAYGDKLSEQEIQDVSAYVLKRAEDNWQ